MKINDIYKVSFTICLLAFLVSCNSQSTADNSKAKAESTSKAKTVATNTKTVSPANSGNVGNIPVYDFESFEPLLHINNDTTYIVNFWATWCKPCVAELPYFEQLHENYKNEKVKVLLVSLDFSSVIEKKLIPFINKRNLKPEVVVLDDPNSNKWIDKVDPEWSGAIPATVIYQGKKRGFFERSFEKYEDLVEVMEGVLKQ
ncbi:MAG: TlpA family protein disulfide reductase [Saprospiraceae bacterium]